MILTGPEIRRQVDIGKHRDKWAFEGDAMDWIDIDPYDESLVGPNSIDLRLHSDMKVYPDGYSRHSRLESADKNNAYVLGFRKDEYPPVSVNEIYTDVIDMKSKDHGCHDLRIPEEGRILWPGVLYLGRTIETIGSNSFVPIVEGRSSVGRLGMHVHVTAGFCDLGFRGTITLEIHVIHPIRVYPNIPICQAYFLEPKGVIELYQGRYSGQVNPTPSRFSLSEKEYRDAGVDSPEQENG